MATADELLSLMSTDGDDKTLVIDNYLRKITIPKGITCLGVEYDDDVLQLDFKMPRYFGDIDLSKFSIRVNYLNAQGEGDVYTVKSPTVTNSNILFTWIVGPTATTYKGDTKFNVCLKLMTADGYIDKEYNTTIATLPVLEGLETDERAIAEYTDILEQWKRELFGIGDTEEASIRAASAEEQENIAQKGAEVLATIPEEYQETAEAAQEGIRTKADAIVCSAQGEMITVSDSSDDHIRNLRVFGKTTQVSTSGKNLIPTLVPKTMNGITMTVDDDGTITLNGTATGGAFSQSVTVSLEPGDYVFSGNNPVGVGSDYTTSPYFAIRDDDMAWNFNCVFATPNHTALFSAKVQHTSILLSVPEGVTVNNFSLRLQLESGNVATEYEPYSGGFASPSPNWPQPLNNVENPTIGIYGKNLLKLVASNQTISGVTFTVNDDQSVTIKGTATASVYYGLNYNVLTLIPGEQYTMTGGLAGSSGTTYRLYAQTIDGKKFYADYGNGVSFTATDKQWQVLFAVYKDTTVDFTIYPALRLKSVTDATYEPYTDQSNITLPYSLPAIPVSENGNYTDANGRQWICDEIDLERGVYIQRVGQMTLTNDPKWYYNTDTAGKEFFYTADNSNSNVKAWETRLLCSHFPAIGGAVAMDSDCWTQFSGSGAIRIRHKDLTSLDELAMWLSENHVTYSYVLVTPIETALTAEELEAFKALKTNYPHTTVLNDAGAHMELSYNVDTKTYVDNGIKQTVTDVLEAIANGSY